MSLFLAPLPCSSRSVACLANPGARSFALRLYAPSPEAIVLPDGSILGVRPPQLPDRGGKPAPSSCGSS